MSVFISSYNKCEDLYKMHLTTINGIKLTFREIDIIACILHNRGEKKIAALCSVSPKTVSAHVHNIMAKMGYGSKDQIIDFIETSDKLGVIKAYYLHLLIKANFEKILAQIGSKMNKVLINFYCTRNQAVSTNRHLYNSISNHLKLANIVLVEVIASNRDVIKSINLQNISEENYYQDLFLLLAQILNSNTVYRAREEFNNICTRVQEINNNVQFIQIPSKPIKFSAFIRQYKNRIIAAIIVIIILLMSLHFIYQKHHESSYDNILDARFLPAVIKNFEEFLLFAHSEQFTSNNLDKAQVAKNQSIVKKVEKLLEYRNLIEIKEYLNKAEMSSDILMHYLHTLQALATYYMYNAHDGIKAKEILLHGKQVAENYVNKRNRITGSFDKLTGAEIQSELQIIKHLPQMYTRIIYSLARSYIYTREFDEGEKYFELAKDLGLHLNLFEGYLSDISGLLMIEIERAKICIKEHQIERAIAKLKKVVELFDKVKKDSNAYISDYNSSLVEQKMIIPTENAYNLYWCETNMINIYSLLIEICPKSETPKYIALINDIIQSTRTSSGLIKIASSIAPRKKAFLYNSLGHVLLNLWDKGYKDGVIKETIDRTLLMQSTDNLDLAIQLFNQAKSISRTVDYTKADAYDGLIKAYEKKLELNNLTEEQRQKYLNEIKVDKIERDFINQKLQRKV